MHSTTAVDASGEELTSKNYMSLHNLLAANYFTEKAFEIEEKYNPKLSFERRGILKTEVDYYVSSVIFFSVAFVESNINELLSDFGDGYIHIRGSHPKRLKNMISKLWNQDFIHKASLLDKYEFAISIIKNKSFDKSKNPYQDLKLLIQLRNSLVHYKPIVESITAETSKKTKIENSLNKKFKLSPFPEDIQISYPNNYLSAGCANWALNSAFNFVDEFYKTIQIKALHSYRKKDLSQIRK